MADTDFTYRVSSTLPPMDFIIRRNGSFIDITNASISAHFKYASGDAVVMSGSVAKPNATAGEARFHITAAGTGSGGFTVPGLVYGQLTLSWSDGIETSKRFTVDVDEAYRVL